jgi:hypothetical protein
MAVVCSKKKGGVENSALLNNLPYFAALSTIKKKNFKEVE